MQRAKGNWVTKLSVWGSILLFSLPVAAQLNSISKDSPSIIINLGDSVNTKYDELAPLITPDGSRIYYGRRNHPFNTYQRKYGDCVDIFYSKYDSIYKKWRHGRHMTEPFNQRIFNGVESISADGKIVYIRGAYKNGHYKGNGISVSYEDLGQWSNPLRLKIKAFKRLNRGATCNFFMASGGKVLLMSFSKTEGGLTNDIFVSFLQEDGDWTKPQELNYPLNTKQYSEEIPFLASDDQTLYFSSDRKGGNGKNDIWVSRRSDESWLNWSEPIVIDTPINSINWEGYCSIDAVGEYIYFVSNNDTKTGSSDIVKAKLGERFRPKPVALIAGKAVTPEKVPLNTMIRFVDALTNVEYARTVTSGIDGSFKVALPLKQKYYMIAEMVDYLPIADDIDLRSTDEGMNVSGNDILGISISRLRLVDGLKDLDLKGATLIKKGAGIFNLNLGNGKIIPLKIKPDGAIELEQAVASTAYTYFIPLNHFAGLDSLEIAYLKREPYINRVDKEDGTIELTIYSGKKYMMKPAKGGYKLVPIDAALPVSKKESKRIYKDIYKVALPALDELDTTERNSLATKAVVTDYNPKMKQYVFTPSSSGIPYLVLKNSTGISLTPVDVFESKKRKKERTTRADQQEMNYMPFDDGSLITSAVGSTNPGDFFYLLPLEAFGMPEDELAELRKNPIIARRDLPDGTTEFTLKSGKRFVIGPSPDGNGYVLIPKDGKGKKGLPNKNILKVKVGSLGPLSDEEIEQIKKGIILSQYNPQKNKYEFRLPSGKKFLIDVNTDGFFTITSGDNLTLTGLDRNFYLGNLEVGRSVLIDNLFFDFAKSTLRPESEESLNKMFNLLEASPQTVIMIQGHTDNVGNLQANLKLSQARTQSVKDYLVDKGIEEERIKTIGYGPQKPLTNNKTDANRQINRRVEFMIIKN